MAAEQLGSRGHRASWREHPPGRHVVVALLLLVLVAVPGEVSAQSNPLNVTLSGSSYLPMRDFATRELNDAWDMKERTDFGWFLWGVDQPSSGLAIKRLTTDARNNTVFEGQASGWGGSLFLLDSFVPGSSRLGKIGANHPIDTTVYKTLYVKFKIENSILNTAPVAQVFWSRDSIYWDATARPNGGSIGAYDDGSNGPVGMFLSPYIAPTWGRLEGGNWIIAAIPLTLEAMKAISPTVDRWRNVNSGATATWGTPGVYADSFRFDPFNQDGSVTGKFQIDWMRLVDDSSPATMTIQWTSGTYDIVVSSQADCSDFAVVAYSQAPGYQLKPGLLPAGTYRVGLRRPFTYSGHTAPTPTTLASCSASAFTVGEYPSLTFTSPHPEGSSDDFATNVLGNAWDFDALTDIDFTREMTSAGLTTVAATDPAGRDLGQVQVFRNTNTVASLIGDPHAYLLWPLTAQAGARARGEHTRIDADRYRILTLEMGVDHTRDINRGSIARIIWHVDGDYKLAGNLAEIESEDITLRHLAPAENGGKVVLETLQMDMADRASMFVETSVQESNSGWSNQCTPTPGYATCSTTGLTYRPGVDLFRVDFHEFPEATNSLLRRVKLAALERTGSRFTVRWTASNPSNLPTTVTLKAVPVTNPAARNYRPADPTCASASAITLASGVSLATGQYAWEPAATAGITPGGEYYVCAQVVASGVGVVDESISKWPVVVSAAGVDALMTAQPNLLRYAAVKDYELLRSLTPAQTIAVTGPDVAWTATADRPWIHIEGGGGTGPGQFTVSIVNPGDVIGLAPSVNGTITVTTGLAGMTTLRIPVTLALDRSAGLYTETPFGMVDTPLQGSSTVVGSIGITGWVLDDIGIATVKVFRNCLVFEPAANCQSVNGRTVVFVGEAVVARNTRPDIELAYPTYPRNDYAGWGYLMLTNSLPHVPKGEMFGGQGPLSFSVLATDVEGKQRWLGRSLNDENPTAVTLTNDTLSKPFGAIDTPAQGGTVSGVVANFGWALTPDADTAAGGSDIIVPTDGSTMWVFIDGVPRGTVTYNLCRGASSGPIAPTAWCDDDVSNMFGNDSPETPFNLRSVNPTRLRNLDQGRAPIGYFVFDSTTLANGVHTIAWSVTDTDGRAEGIGSRYFNVLNAVGAGRPESRAAGAVLAQADAPATTGRSVSHAGVTGRTGFDLTAPNRRLTADADGVRTVRIEPAGRLELQLGDVREAYWLANGVARALPAGSHLDTGTGVFTWAPAVGFFGTYRLVFVVADGQVSVDVVVAPVPATPAGEAEIRMHIDLPATGSSVREGFVVAGWALDPQASIGAGIDAIHVWAWRQDAPGSEPVFLGQAALDGARPDVAAQYGRTFNTAGFGLTAPALEPGVYTVTAYAWAARTARWEDARTVTVTVR